MALCSREAARLLFIMRRLPLPTATYAIRDRAHPGWSPTHHVAKPILFLRSVRHSWGGVRPWHPVAGRASRLRANARSRQKADQLHQRCGTDIEGELFRLPRFEKAEG